MDNCDSSDATRYWDEDSQQILCRCVVCPRCKHHMGNAHQGHYWKWCAAIGGFRDDFHFCCPGDCELEPKIEAIAVLDQAISRERVEQLRDGWLYYAEFYEAQDPPDRKTAGMARLFMWDLSKLLEGRT